jgi:hypothetical protein
MADIFGTVFQYTSGGSLVLSGRDFFGTFYGSFFGTFFQSEEFLISGTYNGVQVVCYRSTVKAY